MKNVKRAFMILTLSVVGLGMFSCFQKTCPTYLKAPVQFEEQMNVQQQVDSEENENV
ncbi:MAG: hypothetical protein JJU28_06280 [Cyclobacteriaceae bacterium]|nr:hypothetical protein [Cyclobacteriaceae bacterium]